MFWSPPYQHLNTYFPVRFLQKYYKLAVAHRNIHLVLNANLTHFETNNGVVTGAHVSSVSGVRNTFRARTFVLAAGGIENSRLLLWSNVVSKGELIKNDHALGRYWMEHPHFTLGHGFVANGILENTDRSQRRRLFIAPTRSTQKRFDILNCGLRVDKMKSGQREVIDDFVSVAPKMGQNIRRLFDQGDIHSVRVRAAWEQEPTIANAVTLSDEVDAVGTPRINLHWQKNERDLRTARVTAKLFGEYIARKNLGRLRLNPWVLGDGDYPDDDELGGNHHMGGTRMAKSHDRGVVDSNCKVFDQKNLYVAGSSVFPSGGHCNPTLTIVQLSVRLGKHIASVV